MDDNTPTQSSPWTGFIMGLLAGLAVSSLFIGMVLGYAIGGGIGGAASGGTIAQNTPPAAPTPPDVPAAPSKPVAPVTDKDHVRGSKNAKVTVIEYSDFECPFCKRHAPTMAQVLETYKDDVNVVYRHFPLSFHPNAQKLAEGSECAAELGGNDAFWKYHDTVFEKDGSTLPEGKLPALAKELGLNEGKFKQCLDSGKYAQTVTDQMQSGVESGVQGTPGNFIVNNATQETKDISGAVPFSSFQQAIDAMLGKS